MDFSCEGVNWVNVILLEGSYLRWKKLSSKNHKYVRKLYILLYIFSWYEEHECYNEKLQSYLTQLF